MPNSTAVKIFNSGSKTFFTASIFFPSNVRDDVFDLYAFVRVADDFVDAQPQQTEEFFAFKEKYQQALQGASVKEDVINRFVQLQKKKNFSQDWADAFFRSMELDIAKSKYQSIEETLEYIYGSAEVIGLMMAKIMDLPESAMPYAAKLGRAFQYMNMIRDLAEDLQLGRAYFPESEYTELGLRNLTEHAARANPQQFNQFLQAQISRYRLWRKEAAEGFHFIPKRYRIPIVAAAESFDRTVDIIADDPQIVFKQKVSSSRVGIFWSVIKQFIQ